MNQHRLLFELDRVASSRRNDANVVGAFVFGDVENALAVGRPGGFHPILGFLVPDDARRERRQVEHAKTVLLVSDRAAIGRH